MSLSAYRNKTAAQLANITDYQTVLNDSYFTSNPADQIKEIIARVDQVRFTTDFDDVQSAIDDLST